MRAERIAIVFSDKQERATRQHHSGDRETNVSSPSLEATMFWFWVMLIWTLQSMFQITCGCVAEERIALLRIRSLLIESNHRAPAWWGHYQVPAWGHSHDCCSWDRVTCDKDTARVSGLNLSTMHDENLDFYITEDRVFLDLNLLSPFRELQLLDLSSSFVTLQNFDGLHGLSKLRNLNLDNNFVGNGDDTMESLSKLPSLEVINLSNCGMNGTLQTTDFKNLKNLQELHLQENLLSGTIPPSLFELPRLKYLDVSDNLLQGRIPITSSSNLSSSLQTLILSRNKLEGEFDLFWLRNHTVLEIVELSTNADLTIGVFHGWVPHFQLRILMLSDCNVDNSITAFLGTQHRLQVLDLSSNNLTGSSILIWIFTNEATLLYLDLSNNLLVGSVDPMWWHQSNLSFINISMNHFEGQLPTNISSVFPNLIWLDASYNNISGYIPQSLCNISGIQLVDLSNNKFIGEVHACLFTDLNYQWQFWPILKLSNNKLGGPIFGGAMNLSLHQLYLDGNKFEGTLPSNLSAANMHVMDLHDNNLSGNLTASYWSLPSLSGLNIASNNLAGEIDPAICKLTDLVILDLSDNKFMGSIPNCNSSLSLQILNMSGNSISGIPSVFFNSSVVVVLDLRYNRFTGTLDWIQHLSQIKILLLGNNLFEGNISSNICRLQFFTIIDFSHNRLSGSLPPCIGDLSFGYHADLTDFYLNFFFWDMSLEMEIANFDPGDYSFMYVAHFDDLNWFTFYTKGNFYTYDRNFVSMMFGVDLSGNMLSGEIPGEVGNLSNVKSLNLSHNSFTGRIPASLGNMVEIESLDLSHNELNGTIPWELTQLSSLEMFSVAYNNLSGCIPDSGQFGTFSMSSYHGNKNLQGMPLGHGCSAGSGSVSPGLEDAGEASDDVILDVVSAASFVLAFWATVAFSFCHPYGRSVMLKI